MPTSPRMSAKTPEPKIGNKVVQMHKVKEVKKSGAAQAKGNGGPSIASSAVESGISFIRVEGGTLPKSTHANEHLDGAEGILVGLTAAIALNCRPCMRYYLSRAEKAGIGEEKVSEVIAKIIAVSANKKRLHMNEVSDHR